MRECWLSENQRLVSQDNFGFDLAAVEAAAKKHEAIETDIFAYEERVQAVISVASELETEKYHDIDRINARRDNVLRYLKIINYLLVWVLKFGAEGFKIRQDFCLEPNFHNSQAFFLTVISIDFDFSLSFKVHKF
jgi:hypothetical protein